MAKIDNKKMWAAIKKLLDAADAIKVSLSKQGLQWNGKEIVSTEPKFKVGDWIIFDENHNSVYQIERIDNYRYYLRHYLGGTMSVHFDNKLIRYWTIQDAKAGDVLAADECYVIFKEIDGLNIKCYCTYHYMGFNPSFYVDTLQNKNAFYPATKEQRDTLFKAMKEEGHVWLSNKRQLVKLLFKEGDTVRKKLDGSIWHINYINEHGYWGNHKPLFPIENQNEFELVEPEPTPSEVTKENDELTVSANESHSILLDETINWDEIRIQAAIAAMKGMLANAALVDSYRDYGISIEKSAVGYANTLIEELRKKG